ncbi:hypothetical protein [Desulfovibrio sp. ZJ200]|uniref:hypothetical protein n=1 Tax=Desulfovibrio sp. ZJ200 TaxID=2709792 RepID=UPI00197E2180|nr:hypothetical protein [Desulfovibrio sp. ZJ200]
MDRFAALDLLRWSAQGKLAEPLHIDRRKELLKPFSPIFEAHKIKTSQKGDSLFLTVNGLEKELLIYPAMWKQPLECNTISISDAVTKYARPMALKAILDAFGI